jgi:hypothetical protein
LLLLLLAAPAAAAASVFVLFVCTIEASKLSTCGVCRAIEAQVIELVLGERERERAAAAQVSVFVLFHW